MEESSCVWNCNRRCAPSSREANLRGMAFDGSYFYVPLPATGQVQKLDRQLGLVATLSVGRRYDLLYWDEVGQVFWAASAEVPRTVFRLSPAFALQETVTLATASCESTPIRSIGVNCRSNPPAHHHALLCQRIREKRGLCGNEAARRHRRFALVRPDHRCPTR